MKKIIVIFLFLILSFFNFSCQKKHIVEYKEHEFKIQKLNEDDKAEHKFKAKVIKAEENILTVKIEGTVLIKVKTKDENGKDKTENKDTTLNGDYIFKRVQGNLFETPFKFEDKEYYFLLKLDFKDDYKNTKNIDHGTHKGETFYIVKEYDDIAFFVIDGRNYYFKQVQNVEPKKKNKK